MTDVFIEHPIPFGELMAASKVEDFDGVPTRICSLEHLLRLKTAAGRAKDVADIEARLRAHERLLTPGL